MERLVVRLLGEPSMQFDGKPWSLKAPPRTYALVALLSLYRDRPPSRAAAAALIWPEVSDAEARANLRRHLHVLQQALPLHDEIEWIAKGSGGFTWSDTAPVWVDVNAFETQVADAKTRAAGLELYRGPLLADAPDAPLGFDRDRLQTLCITACRDEAFAARGRLDFATAIAFADRILTMDEWREDAVRLGMSLRYESGDRSSALALFERFAQRLSEEMGVDPMPETLAVRDAVLMNDAAPDLGGRASAKDLEKLETPRTPFVGRASEMENLEAAWRKAAGGSGTTIFIAGEAGIGKSRLVTEFASFVSAQGGRVLIGETSHPERRPYEAYVDALRRGLALIVESPVGQPWLSAVAELLPELHAALPDVPAPEALEPDKARDRLYGAIARTIERLASVRPLLLVLEDVHWSGAATLEVIETLARRLGGLPLLLAVTYRTGDDTDAAVAAMRQRLQAEGRATSLEPPALGVEDVGTLVQMLPNVADPAEFAATVHTVSEGNPLFAAQLLQGYAETGALPLDETIATVSNVIRARVETLDAQAVTLAEVAATIGGAFTIDVLGSVLGWKQGEVLDAIGTLIDRSLMRTTGSSAFSYSFSHALIANALYSAIPEEQRAIRHRRIAAVLSAAKSVDRSALASVALHWERGGEADRAGRAYMAAAQAAFATYALGEAVALANKGLELVLDPEARFALLRTIAESHRRIADRSGWETDLSSLSDAAQGLGDAERFIALKEWAEYYITHGDNPGVRRTINAMLDLSAHLPPSARCDALFALGSFEKYQGRMAEAIPLLQESLAIALAQADPDDQGRAHSQLCRVLIMVGREREARDELEALRPLLVIRPAMISQYLYAEMDLALQLPDPHLAKRVAVDMFELAERRGDRILELNARMLEIASAERLANAAEIRSVYASAIEFCRNRENERLVTINRSNLSFAELRYGNASRALEIVGDILPALERLADARLLSQAYKNRSGALLLLGDIPGSVEAGSKGAAFALGVGGVTQAVARLAYGTALCAAGDFDLGLAEARAAVLLLPADNPSRRVEHLTQYLLLLLDANRNAEADVIVKDLLALEASHGDRLWLWHPSRLMYALARSAERNGNTAEAKAFVARGKAALEADIARLGEEARASLEALPFNRRLLTRGL
jgi:DNA-binding SARP family transcriptional activator